MRKLAASILRSPGRVLGISALLAFATVGVTFAEILLKSFEFGPGLPQLRSVVRTFSIPSGTVGGVAFTIKYQRLGPTGASNDLPIVIEVREPDTSAGQEGPVVETRTVSATRTEQSLLLQSPSSSRGCSLPWRVRVKYANDGNAPVSVFGTIKLAYDDRLRSISTGSAGTIKKGGSTTVNAGGSGGFEQGRIEMLDGNWVHDVFGLPAPGPVKLKMQLVNPSGSVVATAEGYANRQDEVSNGLQILKLTHRVATRVSGQWKLKITNLETDDDARIVSLNLNFTPDCP